MKKRPLVIKLIALGYLLAPVSFIVQYFIFSKSSIFQASTWMTLLTPYKLSLIILPPIVAFGIFKMRQWGWYLSLVHMFFILGNNTLSFLAMGIGGINIKGVQIDSQEFFHLVSGNNDRAHPVGKVSRS